MKREEKSFLVIGFVNRNLWYFKQFHTCSKIPHNSAQVSKVKPCFGREKKNPPTNTQLLLLRHTRCSRNTPLPPSPLSPQTPTPRTHTHQHIYTRLKTYSIQHVLHAKSSGIDGFDNNTRKYFNITKELINFEDLPDRSRVARENLESRPTCPFKMADALALPCGYEAIAWRPGYQIGIKTSANVQFGDAFETFKVKFLFSFKYNINFKHGRTVFSCTAR